METRPIFKERASSMVNRPIATNRLDRLPSVPVTKQEKEREREKERQSVVSPIMLTLNMSMNIRSQITRDVLDINLPSSSRNSSRARNNSSVQQTFFCAICLENRPTENSLVAEQQTIICKDRHSFCKPCLMVTSKRYHRSSCKCF